MVLMMVYDSKNQQLNDDTLLYDVHTSQVEEKQYHSIESYQIWDNTRFNCIL